MRSASSFHLVLASAVALAAACSSGGSGTSCEADANCPSRSRCVERLCVADAPPVARLDGPETAVENALATFDGSASSDPDDGDRVVTWRWALRPVDAACPAPAALPAASAVKVRFPCAGTWGVDLVVGDALGTESAVASREVVVTPWSGAPRVTAGEDAAVAHRCSGEPLRCAAADANGAEIPLALSAAASADDVVGALTYRWTVTPPPGLALQEDRRVLFDPGADADRVTAVVETDGAAIAGQWVFTVEVRDAVGVIGTAEQVVTIENRAPTVTATVPATVPHRYDPSRRFIAGGAIPLAIVDPDGDAIARREIVARHLDDGPNDAFEAADAGDAITFYAEVHYDAPEDALHLIGPDVSREIELTIEDVNGAVATKTLPIVIGNEPPRPVEPVGTTTVGHTFDAASATYRATARLSRWVDDDGDPIFRNEPTSNGTCATLTVDESGRTTVHCALEFDGVPAVAQFASTHVVEQRVQDPFSWGAVIGPASVSITDRAPVVTGTSGSVSVTCTKNETECCEWDFDLNRCVVPQRSYGAGSTIVSPIVTDPDGDPVILEVTSCAYVDRRFCPGGECPVEVRTCATATCGEDPSATSLAFEASDGALTGASGGSISLTCR
ncbi:MAG TPA: hypothetical protein VD838_09400 [Anaeromyxobacteraceae bacterium]|nr:hypothetical protein [Anaeromyxobacteraceae bacterium]